MGGQGVLVIPNPYDGWIEATVASSNLSVELQGWINQLSADQKKSIPIEIKNFKFFFFFVTCQYCGINSPFLLWPNCLPYFIGFQQSLDRMKVLRRPIVPHL